MMYPVEQLDPDEDNGTMPENVTELADAVVGHRIVSVERVDASSSRYASPNSLIITLDSGKRVTLVDTSDCCAFTEVEEFLLHHERIDHIITGVGTTLGYTRWHIYADFGDVMEVRVGWSCGNPYYYGYGFNILVEEEER